MTPQVLLHRESARLRACLPAVMNGDAEGIHDARIATRRLRELLPLTAEWRRRDATEELYDRFRGVGRALGRVRDADVRVVLLKHLESRIPTAAPSLVVVRQHEERRRLARMRKLIKQLEHEELAGLLQETAHSRRLATGWWHGSGHEWRHQLDDVLAERAAATEQTVRHATGVYFPNRVHAARIAVKKFRYALEIAAATRVVTVAEAVRGLKKAQDVLGELHDRQELIDELAARTPESGTPDPQLALVTQSVEAEIHELHRNYLARRETLLEIAETFRNPGAPQGTPAPWLVAGALVASSGLIVASRKALRQPSSRRM